MARFRSMKNHMRCQLQDDCWEQCLDDFIALPGNDAIGPLFSFLLFGDEMKWRAATALGLVVANIANTNMEQARTIMRRFLWHMNEESGNIGWGIPESMAEVMVNHPKLADDYNRMLHSYIRETGDDDNFLDHPPLRRGVYWGLGRLAQVRPDLVQAAIPSLLIGLEDEDHHGRGLAAWALGVLNAEEALPKLHAMVNDNACVELFDQRTLVCTTTGELAKQAIERIGSEALEPV